MIFVNINKNDKDDVVFAIEIHSELIEDDDNIQFNKIFAVNDSS